LTAIRWIGRFGDAALQQKLDIRWERGDRRVERLTIGGELRRVAGIGLSLGLQSTSLDVPAIVVGSVARHRTRSLECGSCFRRLV
jgi:hypothetical protein